MKNLKSLMLGLGMFVSVVSFGQEKENYSKIDTLYFGNKEIISKYDSLNRYVVEIQKEDSIKREMYYKYYNSTNLEISSKEIVFYNQKKISTKEILRYYDPTFKEIERWIIERDLINNTEDVQKEEYFYDDKGKKNRIIISKKKGDDFELLHEIYYGE